jgi:hypothetical protein
VDIKGADVHLKEVVVVFVLTDDMTPKSGAGVDADEPDVAPEKEPGVDAADEVFCLFCCAVEAESTVSISVREGP